MNKSYKKSINMNEDLKFSQLLLPLVVMISNKMIDKYGQNLQNFLVEKGFVIEDIDTNTSKFFTYYKYEGINSSETFNTLKKALKKIIKSAEISLDKYDERECIQISVFPE